MEGTEDGITLAIKPNGITCTLSKFLPQYIAKNIAFFADGFLKKNSLSRDDGEVFFFLSLASFKLLHPPRSPRRFVPLLPSFWPRMVTT